jgi:transcriptional regulator of arginine metabolism
MHKSLRHLKIKEMLHRHHISNQHDLLHLLNGAGIKVAQATLSRDCAVLGVFRSRTSEGYRLVFPGDNTGQIIKGLVGMEVLSINANETVVIIRTLPGRAHGVGSFIDQLKSPLILGTIAGDDTVLVIPLTIMQISQLIAYIQESLSKT